MRKVNKSTMTDRALKILLNKLNKIANSNESKIERLEEAILKNWKSVFESKGGPPLTNKFLNKPQPKKDFGVSKDLYKSMFGLTDEDLKKIREEYEIEMSRGKNQ